MSTPTPKRAHQGSKNDYKFRSNSKSELKESQKIKVVKLHEQTSEQFLNHTQNPKIAYYQRPKKSKTTPKLSQNQKTQLKVTKSIKACVGAFRTLLFNSYLSPLQCVSLLFYVEIVTSKGIGFRASSLNFIWILKGTLNRLTNF